MDAYAEEQAELERIQKEKAAQEEASRATIYEEWDNEQAMMEADYKLAANLQKNERETIFIEEKSRRLAELIRERKKFFAAQRAKAIRNKPPTKTQRRNQMIQQRVEDDKEEEKLKKCFELAKEEEIEINAIPLATKVPVVGFKIHTRGKPGYYEIFRVDGSLKLYNVFSQLLSEFDREDLVNLWKLVKAKLGDNRSEEDFERVLWGDLRVMFKPDVESEVRRSLQGYKDTKPYIKLRSLRSVHWDQQHSLKSGETLSCEPTVSSLNDEIDFKISFDNSDDEDYTPTVSCFNDLDYFKDSENEFPAIAYNDALTSKSDLLTEPILSPQHIDEFELNDETSFSKYDEEEQNVLYFNDLFPFNIIHR
ncbi:hypothetical protein Tco_0645355 [Tanacetum coccineum]